MNKIIQTGKNNTKAIHQVITPYKGLFETRKMIKDGGKTPFRC